MQDFGKILQRLADTGFEFVIIGGYAAVAHGSSLLTRDLDLCAVLTAANVDKLRLTLAEWHPKHRMTPQRLSFLDHPVAGTRIENLYLQTDVGVLDVLSSVDGVGDFDRLRSRAEELEVDERHYLVISLDDLITAKQTMGREKDLLAAKELRAIASRRQA